MIHRSLLILSAIDLSMAEELPSSINHRTQDNGVHEYLVSGLYPEHRKNIDENISDIFNFDGEVDIDPAGNLLTLRSDQALSSAELERILDKNAAKNGVTPFWAELEARDLKRSKLFSPKLYHLVQSPKVPEDLAWFHAPKERPLKLPLRSIGPFDQHGWLLITPTTALCMCHSRFSLRILDAGEEVLWEDGTTIRGAVSVALSKGKNESSHDVFIRCDDHGTESLFHISADHKAIEARLREP
jgi:hypothetical protein